MCTIIVSNGKKTLVGWNLDLADMPYKVVAERDKVYIAVLDATEGWMPLFGANARGDFVAMHSRTMRAAIPQALISPISFCWISTCCLEKGRCKRSGRLQSVGKSAACRR